MSLVINIFVVAVFAQGLYGKTNEQVRESCERAGSNHSDSFPNNNQTVEADLYKGGVFLGCEFGPAAMYIWAIGILVSFLECLFSDSGSNGVCNPEYQLSSLVRLQNNFVELNLTRDES